MKTPLPVFACLSSIALCTFAWAAESGDAIPAPATLLQDARAAIQRSLPSIEKTSATWITEKKCSSCHVVTFDVWSHTAASVRGIDVDRAKAAESSRWALDDCLS